MKLDSEYSLVKDLAGVPAAGAQVVAAATAAGASAATATAAAAPLMLQDQSVKFRKVDPTQQ